MLILSISDNEFYIGSKFNYDISLNLFLTNEILFDTSIKIKTPKILYFDTLIQIFNKIDSNINLNDVLSKGDEKEFMTLMRKSVITDSYIDLNMLEYSGWYSLNYSKVKANAPFSRGEYIKQIEMDDWIVSNNLKYLFLYYDNPQNNIFNTNNVHILLVNQRISDEFKNNYVSYYQNKTLYLLHSKVIIKKVEDIPIIDIRNLENYVYDFELFSFIHITMKFDIYKIFNKKYILFYFQNGNYQVKVI